MVVPPGDSSELFAGRYSIERVIGHGASATVHLARDTQLGKVVALKILRPELVESAAASRFLKEIRRTSDLVHPNILPVLDSGDHKGQLYFALPYMEGGTLRALLKRERSLPLERVIEIARPIAKALDYANAEGLVHRDVKPENILFTNGEAVLGDFGIARALDLSGSDTTTSKSTIRGTPPYMSPEQAAGGTELDGRSDQYSLACLLYEMITGMQAFIGPTPEAVIAQRFTFAPRPVRAYRPGAPEAIDAAMAKAFAMTPADRYRTAMDLVTALEAAVLAEPKPTVAPAPRPFWAGRTRLAVAAITVTIAAAGIVSWVKSRSGTSGENDGAVTLAGRDITLDTSRFAILPVELEGEANTMGPTASLDIAELVREGFRRWRGINVADAFHVKDVLARRPDSVAFGAYVQRASVTLGAGRYVRLQLSPSGDSLRVTASLFDTRGNASLAEKSVRLAKSLGGAERTMSALVDSLLFPVTTTRPLARSAAGTRSMAARESYMRGHAALEEWNLDVADDQFRQATEVDSRFAEAFLWLAQVRSWKKDPVAEWSFAAEKAAAARGQLSGRDSLISVALLALANGKRDVACGEWSKLTRRDQFDFAGWYSLGNCLAYDSLVVRDSRSPSQWRFRTSYNGALDAYERAFRLLPSMHRSFGGRSFEDVRRLFFTNRDALRSGRAPSPDTMRFAAYASWDADSLAFVPLPTATFDAAREWTLSVAVSEAILQQRKRFHQLTLMWRGAFPTSVDAMEAIAVALDLLGDASAVDTLRVARSLASDSDDRIRMAGAEIWMRVKRALPANAQQLRMARSIADSLLKAERPSGEREAGLLASVAALTGRAALAARYARMSEARTTPRVIAQSGPALVAFAAMGGPVDSIHALEVLVDRGVATMLSGADRNVARSGWLIRAASLAVPIHRFESGQTERSSGSVRASLLAAWHAGNHAEAVRILAELREQRRKTSYRAFDVSPDGLYTEGAILAALGDAKGAALWLDPTLDSLAFGASQSFAYVARAGALVRAMALRAELAAQVNDSATARRWAAPVATLWSDADAFLMPTVARMQQLAR